MNNNDLLKATTKKDAQSNELKIDHPFMSDENILKFSQADYYVTARKKGSWNVGAFFLGGFWLVYRKMYLYAALYFLITTLTYLVTPKGSFVQGVTVVIYAFGLGGLGNRIYLKHVEKKVEKIMTTFTDPTMQNYKISKTGGTSILSVIALILILFILAIFIQNS